MVLQLGRTCLVFVLCLGVSTGTPRSDADAADPASGRVIVLPGIYNTRFHLQGFVKAAESALPPGYRVEVRTWGVPFVGLYNLYAEERNLATAQAFAIEITRWRQSHPELPLYLVGYSGGGGLAAQIVEALPDEVTINRLILVAPAISPDYPLETEVLPKVTEFAVNFASTRDWQVGWGTRVFGTIDRKKTSSAGATGFEAADPRVIEWRWTEQARELGHAGNHLGYLDHDWQAAALLPALDPDIASTQLRRQFDDLITPQSVDGEVSGTVPGETTQ